MDKLFSYDKRLTLEQFIEELIEVSGQEMMYHKINLAKMLGKKNNVIAKLPTKYFDDRAAMSLNIESSKYQHILTYKSSKNKDLIKIVLNHPIFLDIRAELKNLYNKLSETSKDIKSMYSEIINVYLDAMEKMLGDDYEKESFKAITLAELEEKRSSTKEYNKILNSKEFLSQIKKKNEYFKKYKEYYYSIYRDIDYLKTLENQYRNRMSKKIEHLKNIEYYLNQKLRIIYLKLKNTIDSFGSSEDIIDEDKLVSFMYNDYELFLDKTTDILYAKETWTEDLDGEEKEMEKYTALGKRYHYTAVPVDNSIIDNVVVDRKKVNNLLMKYLFLRKILGLYHPINIDKSKLRIGGLVKFVNSGEYNLGLLEKKGKTEYQVMVLSEAVNSDDDSLNTVSVNVDDVTPVMPIKNELYYLEKKMFNTQYKFNLQRYYTNVYQKDLTPHIRVPEEDIDIKDLETKKYPSITFYSNNVKIINNTEDKLNSHWTKTTNYDNEPLLEEKDYESFLDVFDSANPNIVNMVVILLSADSLTLTDIEEIDLSNKIMETLDTIPEKAEVELQIFKELFGGDNTNKDIIDDFDNVRAENVKDEVSVLNIVGGNYFSEDFDINEDNEFIEDIEGGEAFMEDEENLEQENDIKNIYIEPKKKKL